jgi:hypothetical protein
MNISSIITFKKYLKDKILEVTNSNHQYVKIKESLQQGNLQQKNNYYEFKEDAILMYKGKIYVPNLVYMKEIVLREMHKVSYVGNPGYQKKIAVVRSQYIWPGIKKEVANYIVRCLEC